MAYRIYTRRNLADTTRDPDQMIFEELGYKSDLEDAKSVANKYIKERFFRKDTELSEYKDGTIGATDFSSYGATVVISPITIS